MLAPYRTESSIDKYEPKKYGLIKKTGDNPWKAVFFFIFIFADIAREINAARKKHRCAYPKYLARVWDAIKGVPFADDSFYRCQCGKVWEYNKYRGKWESNGEWSLNRWVAAGGEK